MGELETLCTTKNIKMVQSRWKSLAVKQTWASLVAQRWRICLPMPGGTNSTPGPWRSHMLQDNYLWSRCHNCWAHVAQLPKPQHSRARAPQGKPLQWETCALQLGSSPCLPPLKLTQHERTQHSPINIKEKKDTPTTCPKNSTPKYPNQLKAETQNSQKVRTTQASFYRWVNKQNVVYTYTVILCSHKKQITSWYMIHPCNRDGTPWQQRLVK